MIKTICYRMEKDFDTLEDALHFYLVGYECSEGSEQERYASIIIQLSEGKTYCTDED